MGAINTNNESKFNFYQVKDFKFRKNASKETQHAILNKVGDKEYYFTEFKALNGHLHSIETRVKTLQDGREIELLSIWLKDKEINTFECIEIFYHSREAQSFLNTINNANLNNELSIEVCKDKEKLTTFFLIKQDGEIIKRYHSKETPNGLPALQQIGKGKNVKWIDSEMYDFYDLKIEHLNKGLQLNRQTEQNAPKLAPVLDANYSFDNE